jgi:hypothetical protein
VSEDVSGKLEAFVVALEAEPAVAAASWDSDMVELCFFRREKVYLKVLDRDDVIFDGLRIGLHDFHDVVDWVHGRLEKKRRERIGAALCRAFANAVGDCMVSLCRRQAGCKK